MVIARHAIEVAAQAGVLSGTPSGTGADYFLGVCVRSMTAGVIVAPEFEAIDTATGYLRHGPNTRVEL